MTYSPPSEEENPKNYFDKLHSSNSISIDEDGFIKAKCEYKFGKLICKYPMNEKISDKFTIRILKLGKGLWIGITQKDALSHVGDSQ